MTTAELDSVDTERPPPLTDAQKLDAIYRMVSHLVDAEQENRQRVCGIEGRLRLIETAHNYQHPEDAGRECEIQDVV